MYDIFESTIKEELTTLSGVLNGARIGGVPLFHYMWDERGVSGRGIHLVARRKPSYNQHNQYDIRNMSKCFSHSEQGGLDRTIHTMMKASQSLISRDHRHVP